MAGGVPGDVLRHVQPRIPGQYRDGGDGDRGQDRLAWLVDRPRRGLRSEQRVGLLLAWCLLFPADLHRDLRGRYRLGDPVCLGAWSRGQRRLLCHLHPVCADRAAGRPAVAGGARDQFRGGDRQGSIRRHRQEFPEPGAGRACLPVLRLPGRDVRGHGMDRGRWLQRRDRTVARRQRRPGPDHPAYELDGCVHGAACRAASAKPRYSRS